MANEFSLITKIKDRLDGFNRSRPALVVPPGDDAALLSAISRPVITTDTHREFVHFRLDWQTPFEVGRKAATVTLSDLAASYADPVCLFVNLGLPPACDESTVMNLYEGILDILKDTPCAAGGGNIASAPGLCLDLFAIGEGDPKVFPLRSNARPGEGLYATGPLGLARAGLDMLEKGRSGFPEMIRRFKRPVARFDAAKILRENGVTCVMDISDGLAGDAAHIARASNLSIRFTLDESRLAPELAGYCSRYGLCALDMALAGGEDYELLFTCSAETFQTIRKILPEAVHVGECTPYTGSWIVNPPALSSFEHRS
jgi:thiamine-monophosphate kinase